MVYTQKYFSVELSWKDSSIGKFFLMALHYMAEKEMVKISVVILIIGRSIVPHGR